MITDLRKIPEPLFGASDDPLTDGGRSSASEWRGLFAQPPAGVRSASLTTQRPWILSPADDPDGTQAAGIDLPRLAGPASNQASATTLNGSDAYASDDSLSQSYGFHPQLDEPQGLGAAMGSFGATAAASGLGASLSRALHNPPTQMPSQGPPAGRFAEPQGARCYDYVRSFVNAHRQKAATLASQLPNSATPEEVLAVAGNETGYGRTGFAKYGNYFGLHGSGFRGQIDTHRFQGGVSPIFPAADGFPRSGEGFVATVSPFLRGINSADPNAFFSAIHRTHPGPGYGADTPGYVEQMIRNSPGNHGPYALVRACMREPGR